MTITVESVLTWRPDELSAAADRLRRRVAELSAEVVQVQTVRRHTSGHWRGRAGESAQRRLGSDLADGDDLVAAMETVRTRLAGVADSLGLARSRVRAVLDDADAHGFRVAADGTVHPPYLPPPSLAPVSSGELAGYLASYDVQADRLLDEAERRTQELHLALREAELADQHQAATLRCLQLPAALRDRARSLSGRLPDLWATSADAVAFPRGWNPWPALTRGSDLTWAAMVTQGGAQCLPGGVLPGDDDPDALGTGYYGGGFLTGPDGRRYPLVVPQVVRDGVAHRADGGWHTPPVRDLLGRDHGWHQVGATSGVAEFGAPASTPLKVLLAAAGLSGMQPGPGTGYRRRNDLLTAIRVDGLGAPSLGGRGKARPGSPGRATDDPRPAPARAPGMEPGRAERVGGVVSLVANGVDAADLVTHLDDHLTHGYGVALQQNEDGRRRALLTLYDVFQTPDEALVVRRSLGYVGVDGQLRLARADPLYTHHVVVPGPR